MNVNTSHLFFVLLLFCFGTANAQISNVQASFSCPGVVTVTYDLNTDQLVNVTLYYSHNKHNWLPATTVRGNLRNQAAGTGKTIIWNNFADNVRFGKFYFKVEAGECLCNGYVEINDIKWAKCNVDMPGTFAANPEDAGMFYQFNRRVGWSSIDPLENSNNGTVWSDFYLAGATWEIANDPCPGGWHVPTQAEIQSLSNAGVWLAQNGVFGRQFGIEPNTFFLPAVGYRNSSDGTLETVGTYGLYWSGTGQIGTIAYTLYFSSGSAFLGESLKTYGFSVRCVKE